MSEILFISYSIPKWDNKTFHFQCNPLPKVVMTWFIIFPNTVMMKGPRNNLTIKNILEGFQTPSAMIWSMTWKLLFKTPKFKINLGAPGTTIHDGYHLPESNTWKLSCHITENQSTNLIWDLRVKYTYKLKVYYKSHFNLLSLI